MKYLDTYIVFQEVPNEVSLAINLTNCPCHCEGCHSPHLSEDIGEELNYAVLRKLIDENEGITCVLFMGGDADPHSLNDLSQKIKSAVPSLKTAWYSGRDIIPDGCYSFDYIKIGHYDKSKGPLNKPSTNQKFFKVLRSGTKVNLIDETYKFWK